MAFIRTTSGLSNQYLFHNVDFIVFVEGGESYTKLDIDNGSHNKESIDSIFWSKIIEKYKKDNNVKFKPIGSKTAVLKVAEDIVQNNLTTVYAAMDQEFDTILGKIYKHDNILYTFGYSWENDVWNEKVILDIISATSAKEINIKVVIKPFEKFLREVKFSVSADGYLFSKSSSFFPRPRNHMRIIDCNLNNLPVIKKDEVNSLIINLGISKSTVYSYGTRKKICSKTNCYGHLIGDFCKQLIKHILRTHHNLQGLGDEVIRRLAINYFISHMDPEIDIYYKNQIK